MSDQETVLLLGGAYDGEWRRVSKTQIRLEIGGPPATAKVVDLWDYWRHRYNPHLNCVYERCAIPANTEEPVHIFRISTMTTRQALLWLTRGYGKEAAR